MGSGRWLDEAIRADRWRNRATAPVTSIVQPAADLEKIAMEAGTSSPDPSQRPVAISAEGF